MRHTNVKVRVTDHWLDAAEFAAFLSSAPQATNFQQQQPMNSVVQSVNKNVACVNVSQNPTKPAVDGPLPFLDAGGCLIIPFASPRRYHWWAGGQDLVATLDELRAPAAVVRRYTSTKEFEAWLMQGVM